MSLRPKWTSEAESLAREAAASPLSHPGLAVVLAWNVRRGPSAGVGGWGGGMQIVGGESPPSSSC